MDSNLIRKLCGVLICVGLANFLLFSVVAFIIGGNAGGGMIEGGRYYVGTKSHYTQVSHNVFIYSLWHGYSCLITHLLVFISAAILWWLDKKEKTKPRRGDALE